MPFKRGNKLASIGHRNRKARAAGEEVVPAEKRADPQERRQDYPGELPRGVVPPVNVRPSERARRKGVIMTLALHNTLVAAFRDVGPQYGEVARRTGVTPMMARNAWLRGWPGMALPPIQTIVIEERNDARIKLRDLEAQELAQKDHEARLEAERKYGALRQSVVDARAQEGRMVLGMRQNIIDANEVVATSIAAGLAVAKRVKAMVDDPETVISPRDGVGMLAQIASSVSSLSQAGRHVQQMERDLLGSGEQEEPADALNREDGEVDLEAISTEAEQYVALITRHKSRKLRLLKGGTERRQKDAEDDPRFIDVQAEIVDDEAAES